MSHNKPQAYKPGTHTGRGHMRQDNISELANTSDQPIPLLEFLRSNLPQLSRTAVKALLKYDQIRLEGTVTNQFDIPVAPGQTISINLSRPWQTLSNPRLRIIYEDDDIIVVNKGYGLLSVGTDNKKEGTAYSILRDYLKRLNPANKLFIVHRLDQHTSGLMLFAKNIKAKEAMQHNWNNMVLDRRYAAIVEGCPEPAEGVRRSRLLENAQHLMYSTDDPKGLEAVTRYKVLKSRNGYSLVDVSLDTGRKNQIRVHMHDMGTPIAGDRRYGAKTSPIHRLALHARTLRFVHPMTHKDMNFSIPLPASFNSLV